MKTSTHRAPAIARAATAVRDPYQLERGLGIVLWLAFFAVLLSLGD